MSHITEFEHKGKRIIQITFPAGTDLAGLKAIFGEAKTAYERQGSKGILCMTVFDGFEVEESMINLFEAVAKANVGTVKATAFVGVSGPQQALFKAMIGVTGRDGKLCKDIAEAKDWLAEFKAADEALLGL